MNGNLNRRSFLKGCLGLAAMACGVIPLAPTSSHALYVPTHSPTTKRPIHRSGHTWYVSPTARPSGDGSFTNPFRYIQDGMAACQPGDVVMLAPGTYRAPVLWIDKPNITIRGQQ